MTDLQQPYSDPADQNAPLHDESNRLHAHLEKLSEEQFRRQMKQAADLLSDGHVGDAIVLLERCHALHPEDINVLTNLGGAYILAGKHHRAVPHLERATEIAPQNPHVWSNLAAAYLGKLVTATHAKQERALTAYRRVLELDEAYPNVHYNMGLIHVDRREWDDAYEAFSRALHHNPDDRSAANMRRRVHEIRTSPPDPSMN
jgi:tetratricopeptide (TPR) repeat protein